MDCRIVRREGNIVSLTPNYFGAASRNSSYFGTIKKMLHEDKMTHVQWQEDGTTSIIDIDILQLETSMPKKQVSNNFPSLKIKRKFNLPIKPACLLPDSIDEDVDGDPDAELRTSF